MKKEIIEFCPHCETEVEMMWDIEKDGYKAFCPYCGNKLMLCDECMHDQNTGEFIDCCDYDGVADLCFRRVVK